MCNNSKMLIDITVKERMGALIVDITELESRRSNKLDPSLELLISTLKSQLSDFEKALNEFEDICKKQEEVNNGKDTCWNEYY